MNETLQLKVLPDNPAERDLLGLDAIAQAVTDVVCSDSSEPITVGLHGPWGSGKSSLLGLVHESLRRRDATLVIEVNPWEFDSREDVKGTIIASVLHELLEEVDADLKTKLKRLIKRVSWSRVALAVANGALTTSWDIGQLANALTPRPESGPPQTLAGFRTEFADALVDVPVDRVVVLIDDLDRCLPIAVLSTLEAVKLFLAVPKMAFVIAADQAMVREAIAVGLGETRRGAAFARDYLDKIVQVPVTVPQPTKHDAECYVAVLLAQLEAEVPIDLDAVLSHADTRRGDGSIPYLLGIGVAGVERSHLGRAQRIVDGLASDEVVNPRRIKRFINALAVRQYAAAASGVTLDPAVIAKLFMLEHRFELHLRRLAERSALERAQLLAGWEAWASDDTDESAVPDPPDEDLRTLLATEPSLANQDTEKYFVLARKLLKSRFTAGLTEEASNCLRLLLYRDAAHRKRGVSTFRKLDPAERATVIGELVTQAEIQEDPTDYFVAILEIAQHVTDPTPAMTAVRSRRETLTPGVGFLLIDSKVDAFKALAIELRNDQQVPALARRAIEEAKN